MLVVLNTAKITPHHAVTAPAPAGRLNKMKNVLEEGSTQVIQPPATVLLGAMMAEALGPLRWIETPFELGEPLVLVNLLKTDVDFVRVLLIELRLG